VYPKTLRNAYYILKQIYREIKNILYRGIDERGEVVDGSNITQVIYSVIPSRFYV